jgi:flagellar biosynthesis/type III secretory pathway chaperone
MDKAQLVKAFTATVQASLHGMQALEQLLLRERQTLADRDADGLEQVAQEKLALLKQLQHSIEARDRLQQAAGLQPGLEDGGKLVELLRQAAISEDWNGLVELAQRVADLNEINGRLVSQGQRTARAALGILTGRPEQQDTYSTLRRGTRTAGGYSLGKV